MSGDEIPKLYSLESIEQMRAISDELRLRIIRLLAREPMTVTQLGAAMAIAVGKAHYHVRELEHVGLVRRVETREKGGVLEKYYRAVARDFSVPSTLLQGLPAGERVVAASSAMQAATREFLTAMQVALDNDGLERQVMGVTGGSIWATRDEFHALMAQIGALTEPYSDPRPSVEGAVERSFLFAAYTPLAGSAKPNTGPAQEQEEAPPRKFP
jgi:DNA-binding transcriptional ArsR family regulator